MELRAAAFPVDDRVTQTDRALRLWRKTGSPLDADLRELWLHEMRQVRRLMSSAGAAEVIVDLVEMVEDDEAFGIVVEDAGQALSLLHSRAVRSHGCAIFAPAVTAPCFGTTSAGSHARWAWCTREVSSTGACLPMS